MGQTVGTTPPMTLARHVLTPQGDNINSSKCPEPFLHEVLLEIELSLLEFAVSITRSVSRYRS
jgi:hypothetical protein